jgi:hypothetical protein
MTGRAPLGLHPRLSRPSLADSKTTLATGVPLYKKNKKETCHWSLIPPKKNEETRWMRRNDKKRGEFKLPGWGTEQQAEIHRNTVASCQDNWTTCRHRTLQAHNTKVQDPLNGGRRFLVWVQRRACKPLSLWYNLQGTSIMSFAQNMLLQALQPSKPECLASSPKTGPKIGPKSGPQNAIRGAKDM